LVNLDHQEDQSVANTAIEADLDAAQLQISSVLIASSQLDEFFHILSKLNKKTQAFGLPSVSVLGQEECVFARQYEFTRNDNLVVTLVPIEALTPSEREVAVLLSMVRIKISYPIIRMGNWQVVGKLEREEGADAFAYVCNEEPDVVDAITRYRDAEPICEHCRVKRKRSGYYVVRDNDAKEFRQVGSSCLKDYTGIDPAAALFLAKMWTFIHTAPELRLDGENVKSQLLTTDQVVARTLFLVQQLGFSSKKKVLEQGGCSTSEFVQRFANLLKDDRDLLKQWGETSQSEAFDALVQSTLSYYRALDPCPNLFDENVRRALLKEYIPVFGKILPFVVAAVARRYLDSLTPKEEVKPSVHVGKVGEKMERALKLNRRFVSEGMWGLTWTLLFEDEEHNVFVWKTGSPSHELAHADLPMAPRKFRFTIKNHSDYKSIAQTEIIRVKWLESPA